jgi:hypothetical protein
MSPRAKDKGGKGGKSAKGGSAAAGIRWFAILIVSLLLWAPSGMAALEGTLSMDGALLRYAVAVALCWVGISAISRITDTYTREQARKRLEEEAGEDAGGSADATQRRRSEDRG